MAKTPTLRLCCYSCGDERLKKLSLIYLEGTSNYQNIGVNFYRGLSRQAVYTSMGKRQSLLAQRAAPPRKKSPFLRGILWLLAACVLGLLALSISSIATAFIFGATILGGALHLRNAHEYNETEWRQRYQTWDKSFLCRQCGKVTVFRNIA